jgi:hypothetical protein
MLKCPQCTKVLPELSRRCPTCMADLDLLVDYVQGLQGGLDRAYQLTRAGELAAAVWTYLEVLEVDPDNPTARRQVGQVATAVRQFDRTAPGRRWLFGIRGETPPGEEGAGLLRWVRILFVVILIAFAFTIGFGLGSTSGLPDTGSEKAPPKLHKQPDTLR